MTRLKFHRYQHVRTFDTDSLGQLLAEQGFTPIQVFTTNFASVSLRKRIHTRLRGWFGRKMPHLVYIGRLHRENSTEEG